MQTNETNDPIYAHLDSDTEVIFNNFIKELKNNTLHPVDLVKKYNPYFDNLNQQFKKHVLKNEKAKSGLFVSRYKNYAMADYLRDKFNFTKTRSNLFMRYEKQKLIDLTLFEITLLLRKYNYLYPFMIRYAIYRVLTQHFAIFEKTEEGWKLLIYPDDLNNVYARVIDTPEDELTGNDTELTKALFWKRAETQNTPKTKIVISEPKSAEDLTCLFDSSTLLKQKDKFKIIAEHYGVSTRTAERWMARFGLCQTARRKSNNAESTDSEKARLLARIKYLENENRILQEENKRLKEEKKNNSLFQNSGLDDLGF